MERFSETRFNSSTAMIWNHLKEVAGRYAMQFKIFLYSNQASAWQEATTKEELLNDLEAPVRIILSCRNQQEKSILINAIKKSTIRPFGKDPCLREYLDEDGKDFNIDVEKEFVLNSLSFIYIFPWNKLFDDTCKHGAVKNFIKDKANQLNQFLENSEDIVFLEENGSVPEFITFSIDIKKLEHVKVIKNLSQNFDQKKVIFDEKKQTLIIEISVVFILNINEFLAKIKEKAEKTHEKFKNVIDIYESPSYKKGHNNYQVLLSEKIVEDCQEYLKKLIDGEKQPGCRVQSLLTHLGKSFNELSLEEFINLILQTKKIQFLAEKNLYGRGLDWNDEEIRILSNLNLAVPVHIFDNGTRNNPKVYKQEEQFDGYLMYTSGALLAEPHDFITPDYHDVINSVNGKPGLDVTKLEQLYEQRWLSLFVFINETMKAKNQKAFITIPGLGCGAFAGKKISTQEIKKQFTNVLKKFLEKHAAKFSCIQGVWLDVYNESDAFSISIKNGMPESLWFICQPLISSNPFAKKGVPPLCPPIYYGEQYKSCVLFHFVAADPFSWPGNELLKGGANARPMSDDPANTMATNALSVILAWDGSYYSDEKYPYPGYVPKNYEKWAEAIEKEKLKFYALGKIYVSMITVDGSIIFSKLVGNQCIPLSQKEINLLTENRKLNPPNLPLFNPAITKNEEVSLAPHKTDSTSPQETNLFVEQVEQKVNLPSENLEPSILPTLEDDSSLVEKNLRQTINLFEGFYENIANLKQQIETESELNIEEIEQAINQLIKQVNECFKFNNPFQEISFQAIVGNPDPINHAITSLPNDAKEHSYSAKILESVGIVLATIVACIIFSTLFSIFIDGIAQLIAKGPELFSAVDFGNLFIGFGKNFIQNFSSADVLATLSNPGQPATTMLIGGSIGTLASLGILFFSKKKVDQANTYLKEIKSKPQEDITDNVILKKHALASLDIIKQSLEEIEKNPQDRYDDASCNY